MRVMVRLLLLLLLSLSTTKALRSVGSATTHKINCRITVATTVHRATELCAKRPSDSEPRIVGKDNLGEPIYEGQEGETLNILGAKLPIDPLTGALAIFALIAFQFFVVANL